MIDVELDISDAMGLLDDMKDKAVDRCIRTALKAGADIEVAAISERAPVNETGGGSIPVGALKADIGYRLTRDDTGELVAIVGPGKSTSHVSEWVEYGHKIVTGGYRREVFRNGDPTGTYRGPGTDTGNVVEPHSFIRDGFEATATEVTETIASTLADEIVKAASRKGNLKG